MFLWIGIGSGIASERRQDMGKGRSTGCHAVCGASHNAVSLPDEFGTVPAENNPLERMRGAVEDRRAGVARVRGDTGDKRCVLVRLHNARRKLRRQAERVPDGVDWLPPPDRACLLDRRNVMTDNRPVKPKKRPVRSEMIQVPSKDFPCLVNIPVVDDKLRGGRIAHAVAEHVGKGRQLLPRNAVGGCGDYILPNQHP